jgi:hypothetical protein
LCISFCLLCISMALECKRECPLDRSALSLEALVPNIMLRGKMGTLSTRCRNACSARSAGGRCAWVGPLASLQAHLRDGCAWQRLRCGHAGCGAAFWRADEERHAASCAHAPQPCAVRGCGAWCTRGTMGEHMRAAGEAHAALLQKCLSTTEAAAAHNLRRAAMLGFILAGCVMKRC